MEYFIDVIDRDTGELQTKSIGQWVTVTELAHEYGVGPRVFRKVLHRMNLLQPEGYKGWYRLTHEAVSLGYGKRNKSKRSKYPFDTLSPLGQAYVASLWAETVQEIEEDKTNNPLMAMALETYEEFVSRRKYPLSTKQSVYWFLDNYPNLLHKDIAVALSMDPKMVSHYVSMRKDEREKWEASKSADLVAKSFSISTLLENNDEEYWVDPEEVKRGLTRANPANLRCLPGAITTDEIIALWSDVTTCIGRDFSEFDKVVDELMIAGMDHDSALTEARIRLNG